MQTTLIQIHKELELVAFRFLLQFFDDINNYLRQFKGNKRGRYSKKLMNMANSFISLEIK